VSRLADLENRVIPHLKPLMRLHPRVYRATGGRIGRWVPGLPPLLILDHVGAKSGIERSSVIGYVLDGEDVLLVASQGGNPKNPAWFHNLKANPDARIQIGREVRDVRARVAAPGEREELWKKAASAWPVFDRYQQQTDRVIPIIVLEPRGAGQPASASTSAR
jgi:deazaflavin-dependent oxidoreductase (nitroreductase family)